MSTLAKTHTHQTTFSIIVNHSGLNDAQLEYIRQYLDHVAMYQAVDNITDEGEYVAPYVEDWYTFTEQENSDGKERVD